MRKMNRFKALLITGLVGMCSFPLLAGNPVSVSEKPEAGKSPKVEKDFCVIRGFYEEVKEGEVTYVICRLVSTAKCVSIPCNVWGPYGPNNAAVYQAPMPPNLAIEPGKNYIVTYDKDGGTTVKYVNSLQVEEKQGQIAIHFN
jgi:hypothetical protein